MDVVDPFPALKQLMLEADHSALFSSVATDQCSYNCASPVCFHGVHRDNFACTVVLQECLQYLHGHNSAQEKMRAVWSPGTLFLFSSTVLFQNTECCYLMICNQQECLETSAHVAFPSV